MEQDVCSGAREIVLLRHFQKYSKEDLMGNHYAKESVIYFSFKKYGA
ncbi:mCG148188 [Mus musculus]|jgi:hypothetical protein|nr:mCG148188 [Mus musculus]